MSLRPVAKVPVVKGWCPGAHRPMMSGDGLVVRVRPRMGRLDPAQISALAEMALEYGNGVIDLTSRGNLQLRGVKEAAHQPLLRGLLAANLLDSTPEAEARRNILVTPFWRTGDLTSRLHRRIVESLSDLPELPAKMGIVLDTGEVPLLQGAPGDFRFERATDGALVLQADGALSGMAVSEEDAAQALVGLANWFVKNSGAAAGRMGKLLEAETLPDRFLGHASEKTGNRPEPGPYKNGFMLGAAFGTLEAEDIDALVQETGAQGIRLTPWRMFLLEGVTRVTASSFIDCPDDPALRVHACPGAPYCAQAEMETRPIAQRLARRIRPGTNLHVSGCSKGCAHPAKTDITLVGENGRFNLVRGGAAWDEPSKHKLSSDAVLKDILD